MTVSDTRIELRCRSRRQGIIKEYPDGKRLLEIRCKDHWCADKADGAVVIHYFNVDTGELDHTSRYRDPAKAQERTSSKTNGQNGKVRNP